MNEKCGILPVCRFHHEHESRRDIRERLDHVMVNRMTDEQLEKYSRGTDWIYRKKYLNKKYDEYNNTRKLF